MLRIARGELAAWPRGPRCSDQNIFRAAFFAARMNSLGMRPQIARSREASIDAALCAVRAFNPTFAPTTGA
jgi:hypothetical protein